MNESTPSIVDVAVFTYNHVKYVRQTLDGVLMQETNFAWRILVMDDCSTDGTQEVILDYARQHPGVIVPLISPVNVGITRGKKTHGALMVDARVTAKYLAFLDGDDYWTDSSKLQRQIDLLEAHPEVSMCCHNYQLVNDDGEIIVAQRYPDYLPPLGHGFDPQPRFGAEELMDRNFIGTSSVVARSWLIKDLPMWVHRCFYVDLAMWVRSSQHGLIAYMPEVMSAYRIHSKGVCTIQEPVESALNYLKQYEIFVDHLDEPHSSLAGKHLFQKEQELKREYVRYACKCIASAGITDLDACLRARWIPNDWLAEVKFLALETLMHDSYWRLNYSLAFWYALQLVFTSPRRSGWPVISILFRASMRILFGFSRTSARAREQKPDEGVVFSSQKK